MNVAAGTTKSPLAKNPDASSSPPVHEPEVENPRTSETLLAPPSIVTPLRGLMTPPSPSPMPSSSGQKESASSFAAPSSLQATVETAPPTPCVGPVKGEPDDPAAVALQEGPEEGREDHEGGPEDREQESISDMEEPPTLFYVQPSPEQIQRGEPLTGWLCEPGWLRRRVRDFAQQNMRGEQ